MKRILYLILSLIFILIPFSNRLEGQNIFENAVSFDKVVHDFGDVLLSDGKMSCIFKMKNISSVPIAIYRVITSCGCMEPSWTKAPIKPDEVGEIKVTYLNDQGPYPFSKRVTVYVSGLSKPIILKIQGIVHEKQKSLKELFPVSYGSVGLREKKISMGQIEQGMSRTIDVEIANTSHKKTEIDFTDLTPGLSVSIENKSIPANSKEKFTCTINTAKTSGQKWGKTPFSFTLINNGKRYSRALIIEPLIKENFTSLTESQKRAASLPQFNTTSIEFGTVSAGTVLEGDYVFRNIGKEPFIIYKADSNETGFEISYGGAVNFGDEGKVHIKLDTKGKEAGEMLNVLTLITNSPTRPIINLFAVYNIEKEPNS